MGRQGVHSPLGFLRVEDVLREGQGEEPDPLDSDRLTQRCDIDL
jgi:hypothetical protein